MTQDGNRLSRRHFVVAGATGLAGAVAGCMGNNDAGGSNTDTKEPTETSTTPVPERNIQLAGWAADDTESQLLKQLIDSFEESNPNITVDYNAIQSKYKQKLKTQLGAGNAPDVFYVDAKFFGSFASQGVLLSLDGLTRSDEFDTDDFFQPLLDAFKYDGTLYGVPKDFSTLGLFYNTAMFEEAGVEAPETWSDFRSALAAVKEATDVKAPLVEYPNARMWKAMLFQNGGSVLNDAGDKAVFASESGVEALDYLVELKKDGLLAVPSELGAGWHGAALGSKEVAAAVLGPWGLPFLEQNHPDVDENVDVAHLPIPDGGQKATAAYTVSYSASAATDAPGAARELIKGMTSSEGMAKWAEKGLALSARKSHRDLDYYKNHPRRKTLLEAGEWSHPVAYGPKSEQIINILHPQLEAAMLEKKSPQKALETAQTKINSEVF